jgi:hypothetical protein
MMQVGYMSDSVAGSLRNPIVAIRSSVIALSHRRAAATLTHGSAEAASETSRARLGSA